MYKSGQLLEVSGLKEEGFPQSFVLAVCLENKAQGANVQYLEFIDEDTGEQLVEEIPHDRLRPLLPVSARFETWDQLQVGLAVELHQDDVWWQGLVLRKTPAGVHVYMPDIDHSSSFVKLLRNLRPAYDWEPATAAQQQQQPGHWVLRRLSSERLQEFKLAPPDEQGPHNLPAELPHEPLFSELTSISSRAAAAAAAAAAAPSPRDATAAAQGDQQQAAAAAAAAAVGKAGKPLQLNLQQPSDDAAASADADMQDAHAEQHEQQEEHEIEEEEEEEQRQGDLEDEEYQQHDEDAAAGVSGRRGRARAAAAAAAATAADLAAPRRSSREGKKRVVYVDGIPVLRDNLYGEEGEPSVFQKELAAKPYTEQGYPTSLPSSPAAQRRQHQLQHLREQRQQQQQQREARCLATAAGGKAGKGGAGLAARRTHNAGIKATKQASATVRAAYLATHLSKLRPFIAPAVAEGLERAAAAAPQGALVLPEPPSSQPAQIKATLRDYQLEGLAWLVSQHQRGLNSILADEMGLGKTLQSISFLAHLKWVMGVPGPHLVVVPLSVMSSWMNELAKWCPELRAVRLHTSDVEERKRLRKEVLARPDSFDVAVTTYEMVTSPDFGRPIQSTLTWRYLVLDEGHRVRNDTLTVKALRLVRTGNVLLLTGTPLQNNMVELYGLLSFMYPDIFTTPGPFEAAFNLTKGQVDQNALSAAHYLLRPFCLRRIKDEVEVDLPPKVETRIAVPLSEQQTFWYRRLLLRNHEALSALESSVAAAAAAAAAGKALAGQGNAWKRLMNLIMQLRKVVNHPFMLPDSEPCGEGSSDLQQLLEASGKLTVLDRLLCKLKARGHRVVLFSQFTSMMDILEDYLEQAGHEYTRLDGSVNRVQRMINISQFMKPNSSLFIFLASTRSGGLGLNLQAADTVILYDSDWNPQWDLQAMARVHRIGQTKPVHVYRLITSSSVEERMLQRADSKLYLDQMVNRGSTAKAEQLDNLNTAELLSMLSFGADRILANQAGQAPSDADLDTILDRSKDVAAKAAAGPAVAAGAAAATAAGVQEGEQKPAAAVAVKQEKGEGEGAAGQRKSTGGNTPRRASKSTAAEGAAAGSSEAAAAGAGGGAVLMSMQLTAANFQPAVPPPNTFTLNGVDYSAAALEKLRAEAAAEAAAAHARRGSSGGAGSSGSGRTPLAVRKLRPVGGEGPASSLAGSSGADGVGGGAGSSGGGGGDEECVKATLRAIGREYWAARERQRAEMEEADAEGHHFRPERARQARLVDVDGYQVLKVNNYDAEQGGISAWHETAAGVRPANGGEPPKRKLQKAGRDYAHSDACQVCWDGGELICCDVCPASYHAECLGQDPDHLAARNHWACPHHSCASCGRGPAASGGLLFRCCVCECSWCEDHLPAAHEIMGEWPLFQALGQNHPSNACFVLCGPDCQELQQRLAPTIAATIQTYESHPELRYKEAEEDEQGNLKAKKKARKVT